MGVRPNRAVNLALAAYVFMVMPRAVVTDQNSSTH
jgi:hypothetical protein